ncbi:T9SS type A sorting domain-containing protein [uncultured Tenacibaculum sp.]|uniref:T9SS type A sorting domain-containing protein n=1 Tax=uncultured Tenacibaculum sp. TaxID=174713 RepID=UPI00262C632C|nr:T9SS type A sorting domain-containing protein [uncultured Tenacibaculum sp.]
MKKFIPLVLFLFFSILSHAQTYKIEVKGYIGQGRSSCGTRKNGLKEIKLYFQDGSSKRLAYYDYKFINQSYSHDDTFNVSKRVTRVEFHTITRRNGTFGCKSSKEIKKTVNVNSPCFYKYYNRSEVYKDDIGSGWAQITITPNASLSFSDGSNASSVKTACLSSAVGIKATAGFTPTSQVYTWEFFDNVNTDTRPHPDYQALQNAVNTARAAYNNCVRRTGDPDRCEFMLMDLMEAQRDLANYSGPQTIQVGVWRAISNKAGQSSINLRLSDIYSSAADRNSALTQNILVRMKPSCNTQFTTNTVTVQYLPDAPQIARAPTIVQPTCSYSTNADFKLFFTRQVFSYEKIDFNLLKKTRTNQYVAVDNNTGITSFVRSGSNWMYDWRPTSGTLAGGEYRVEVTGFNRSTSSPLCEKYSYDFVIAAPPKVVFSASKVQDETCYNSKDGKIKINGAGGSGSFYYSLNNGTTWSSSTFSGSTTISGLAPGGYTIRIRDTKGCIDQDNVSDPITISSKSRITHTLPSNAVTHPSAAGNSDASIRITRVNGGTPFTNYYNYTVLLNGSSSNTVTGRAYISGFVIPNLPAGTHKIRYTDKNNCTQEYTLPRIIAPQPVAFTVSSVKPDCYRGKGRINVTSISGGYPNYTVTLKRGGTVLSRKTGVTSSTYFDIEAGNYTILIKDTRQGNLEKPIQVLEQSQVVISGVNIITPIKCNGQSASVRVSASGGKSNSYQYAIYKSSGIVWQNSNTFSLPASAVGYRFIVRDRNVTTCRSNVSSSVVITEPLPLEIVSNTVKHNTIYRGATGEIRLSIAGGITNYTVTWRKRGDATFSKTGNPATGLRAGFYTATVRDRNNCQITSSEIEVRENPQLLASLSITKSITCNGGLGSLRVTASGGSNSYTYKWYRGGALISGRTTNQLSNVVGGNYSVTVNDGFTSISKIISLTQPSAVSLSTSKTDITCNGADDGTIKLTINGGIPPYQYSIDNQTSFQAVNSLTNNTIEGLTSGGFAVWIRDNNGCVIATPSNVTINEPTKIVFDSSNVTNCETTGGNEGAITISTSGGDGTLIYQWTKQGDGAFSRTTKDISGLYAGTYQVVVKDRKGCQVTQSFEVREPQPIQVAINITKTILCKGEETAELVAAITGGYPINSTPLDFEYRWYNITSGTPVLLNTDVKKDKIGSLKAGTYRVVVNDVKGATTQKEIVINEPAAITVSLAASTNVNCFGGGDGSIDVTVLGGTTPYSFLWKNTTDATFSKTTEDVTGLEEGTYYVEITDANGCKETSTNFVIQQPSVALAISNHTIVNLTGFETKNGSISVNVTGGTPNYTYEWRLKGNTAIIGRTNPFENIDAGEYQLTVRDANGCTTTEDYVVTQPEKLLVDNINQTGNILCFGDKNVRLVASATGGVMPYTYSWKLKGTATELSAANTLDNIGAGTYEIKITDKNGNIALREYEVTQPLLLEISGINKGDVSCFGGSNGFINVSVSGGRTPYSYSWKHGATSSNLNGLSVGEYEVTIRDKNLCEVTRKVTVNQPLAAITIDNHTIKNVSGFGLSNGEISINVVGGTPSYTYEWRDARGTILSSTSAVLSGVKAGDYSVKVTDTKGCLVEATYRVTEPDLLTVAVRETSSILCKNEVGTLVADVTGGVAPYNYSWKLKGAATELSTVNSLANVSVGTYEVTVTDKNSNVTKVEYELTEPLLLEITSINKGDVSCHAGRNGFINISVSGGVTPYTYNWRHGATGSSLSSLSAGEYEVTIRDKNLCEVTRKITIQEPAAALSIDSHAIKHVSGFGLSNGEIRINVVGGTPNYTYEWKNASGTVLSNTSAVLSGIKAGDYSVKITDTKGCLVEETYTVNEPGVLSVAIRETSSILCKNGTGTLVADVSGGILPYTYSWKLKGSATELSTTNQLENIGAGTYVVSITDKNTNVVTKEYELIEPSLFEITGVSKGDVSCFGGTNGFINVSVSGGTTPYSYTWKHGATGSNLSSLSAGEYEVTIRDKNLCELTRKVTIDQPLTAVTIDNHSIKNVSGFGLLNGEISINVVGGSPNYTYEWKDASGTVLSSTNAILSGIGAGNYSVKVTDTNGCFVETTYTVTEPGLLEVTVRETSSILCKNGVGTLVADVSGGTLPYTYSWKLKGSSSKLSVTDKLENVAAGTYIVTISDRNSNTVTKEHELTEPSLLAITGVSKGDVTCFGGTDGFIEVTVSGGVTPYTYSWKHASVDSNRIENLSSGEYSVTITDKNGCAVERTVNITQPIEYDITKIKLIRPSSNLVNDGSIEVTIIGGVAPYTYEWKDGNGNVISTKSSSSLNDKIENLSEGRYTIKIKDASNCVIEETYNLANPGELLVSIEQVQEITCFNASNAILDVITIGGVGGNNYAWYNADTSLLVGNKKELKNIPVGNYYVVVSNAEGIEEQSSIFTVSQPTEIKLTISKTDLSCFNANNGSFEATIVGGTGNYEFRYRDTAGFTNWSSVTGNTIAISNLKKNTYTLQVRDTNNCMALHTSGSSDFSIDITEPLELLISSEVIEDVTGFGLSNGSISATLTGGTPPYSYEWKDGSGATILTGTNEVTGIAGGNYELLVTDSKGCSLTKNYVVAEPSILAVNIVRTAIISCNGEEDGALKAEVTGGVAGYTYKWYKQSSTPLLVGTASFVSGLGDGVFYVEIEDTKANKVTSASFELKEPEVLVVGLNSEYTLCGTGNDWTINTTLTGGTAPYTYIWNTGSNDSKLQNVIAGNYEVTILDANGCRVSQSVTLTPPPTLAISNEVVEDVTGFGLSNGSISVTLTGGTPPYSYEWKDGLGATILTGVSEITGISGGNYQLIVTDSKGCSLTKDYIVTEPLKLEVSIVRTAVISCNGEEDGALKAEVTGGVIGYTYKWYKQSSTPVLVGTASSVSGLGDGVYYVEIEDTKANKVTSASFELKEPQVLALSVNSEYTLCGTGNDWTINTTVTGGTAPYTYLWNTGSNETKLQNVVAGNYDVTIVDTNGCRVSQSITLTPPPALAISNEVVEDVTGFGLSNGSISVALTGGTPPYSFEWKDGSGVTILTGANEITGISGGNYQLMVTDSKGCSLTKDYVVTEPLKLEVSIVRTAVISCNGEEDGALKAEVTGGVAGYSYKWYKASSTPPVLVGTSSSVSGLGDGVYYVEIEDTKANKVTSASFELREPEVLAVTLSSEYTLCATGNDWTINTTVTGGTAPYTYLWNTGSNNTMLQNMVAGNYEVTIVDANGCRVSKAITLTPPPALAIVNEELINPTCYQGNDGSIRIETTGGTPPYNYTWSNTMKGDFIEGLSAGVYSVLIEDSKGCSITKSFTIIDPEQIQLDLGDDVTLCIDQTYILDATILDGVRYSWRSTNGFTSDKAVVEVADAGVYTVIATDKKGCQIEDSIEIKRSNREIISDFAVSTQVFTNEYFVAVNISDITPEEVEWIVPNDAVIKESSKGFVELKFEEAGEYEITMIARIGACEATKTKRVIVIDREIDPDIVPGEEEDNKSPMITNLVIYPNPSSGKFAVDIELKEESFVSIKVLEMLSGNIVDAKTMDSDKEYKVDYDLKLIPGVYFVLIETKDQRIIQKIIIN